MLGWARLRTLRNVYGVWSLTVGPTSFFSPTAHICAVTYITEISLHVMLSNQSLSLSSKKFALLAWVFTAKDQQSEWLKREESNIQNVVHCMFAWDKDFIFILFPSCLYRQVPALRTFWKNENRSFEFTTHFIFWLQIHIYISFTLYTMINLCHELNYLRFT